MDELVIVIDDRTLFLILAISMVRSFIDAISLIYIAIKMRRVKKRIKNLIHKNKHIGGRGSDRSDC